MIGVDVGKYCCESYESIENYEERTLTSKDGRVIAAVYSAYKSVGGTMSWREW